MRRLRLFILLIALLPSAVLLMTVRSGVADPGCAARQPAAQGTGGAAAVGLVSVPLVVFGLLVSAGYWRKVLLYRHGWSRRGDGRDGQRQVTGQAGPGLPG